MVKTESVHRMWEGGPLRQVIDGTPRAKLGHYICDLCNEPKPAGLYHLKNGTWVCKECRFRKEA